VGRLGGHLWIAKFDGDAPSPVLAWQKSFGGAGNEAGNAVATERPEPASISPAGRTHRIGVHPDARRGGTPSF
jgi:hypothetical protein